MTDGVPPGYDTVDSTEGAPATSPDDLLVRLVNHRLSEDRTRREDYLTECFAWLLARDAAARAGLLGPGGLFYPGQLSALAPPDPDALVVVPQERLSRHDRPDIVLRAPDFLLVLESKVDAPFDAGQIRRYLTHVTGTPRGAVAAIVPAGGVPVGEERPTDPRFLGILSWAEIGTALSKLTAAGGGVGEYRRSFLRLLEHFGLTAVEGVLAWQDENGQQRIDQVRRICGIFGSVVAKLGHDPALLAEAPSMYRQPSGRLWFEPRILVSAKGPTPRPVLEYDLALQTRWGGFLAFRTCIFFQFSRYMRASRGPSVCALLGHYGKKGVWGTGDLVNFRQALGRAVPNDDGDAVATVNAFGELFLRRCEELFARFAEGLRETAIPLVPHPSTYRDWGINFPIAATRDLCGADIEADELRARFEEWLRAILHAWFAADPERPLARLALDVATR